jgi:hypothetical protein
MKEMKDEIIPDYGWAAPIRTNDECSNPEFSSKHYHRVAIMKQEHFGAIGDRDENGLPGWVTKLVCNGCGREFKNRGFYPDTEARRG